ncbi:MAG: aspartate kinase [Bacteroidota bacterium]
MKFGGTSVGDAKAMRLVLKIVEKHADRQPLVVLSACAGMTNNLLKLAQLSAEAKKTDADELLLKIYTHHKTVCEELIEDEVFKNSALQKVENLYLALKQYSEGLALLKECTPRSLDTAASFGERLSTEIFTQAALAKGISAEWLDARKVMRTDSNFTSAEFDMPEVEVLSKEHITPQLLKGKVVITQGFIGATAKGITTTLGRGGSDLSAAIYGAALDAEEIQIWTDVSGVFSADPRKVPNAHVIPQMSYLEARDLSFYGAKVLHPDTVRPAIDKNIPVRVLNTFDSEHPGTAIVSEPDPNDFGISAVTLKENCSLYRCNTGESASRIPRDEREKIYAQLRSEGAYLMVLDASLSKYFPAENQTAASLLCASGPNLLKPRSADVIQKAFSAISQHDPLAFMFGTSAVSLLAVLKPENGQAAMSEVHKLTEE